MSAPPTGPRSGAQRLCITVEADRFGWPHDEEAWVPASWARDARVHHRALEAFAAYLADKGIRLGGLHVGTEDWVRDRAGRSEAAS